MDRFHAPTLLEGGVKKTGSRVTFSLYVSLFYTKIQESTTSGVVGYCMQSTVDLITTNA